VASFNWIGKIAATNFKARFAAARVRVVDGPPQRIRGKGQQHLPEEEVWLIGEHKMSGG
jgi:SRSO17 transposase